MKSKKSDFNFKSVSHGANKAKGQVETLAFVRIEKCDNADYRKVWLRDGDHLAWLTAPKALTKSIKHCEPGTELSVTFTERGFITSISQA